MASPRSSPLLLMIFLLVGLGTAWAVWGTQSPPIPVPVRDSESTTAGLIRGTTIAADGSHPADLVVCAQSTSEAEQQCIAPGKNFTFELSVSPGQYLVSAHRTSQPDVQAFYTDRVTCTEASGCSGQPIVVNVAAGQALDGINPVDWTIK